MKTQFTFTHQQGGSQNLSRLLTIMEKVGHEVEEVNTHSDFCRAFVDGIEFCCDWKHNELKAWGSYIEDLGHTVIKCDDAELVIEVEHNFGPLVALKDHETHMAMIKMFQHV